MLASSSHLTSVCARRHSRGPPIRESEAEKVRYRSGQRPFGPGRCTQHVAPHPCISRQRKDLHEFLMLLQSRLLKRPFLRRHVSDARCSQERRKTWVYRGRVYPVRVQVSCVSLSLRFKEPS